MAYPKLTPIVATGATEPRYVGDRFADTVTPLDFGAKGDGITDDSSAFSALETAFAGKYVDCLGKIYVVSEIKTGAKYFNGKFKVDGTEYPVEYAYSRAGCFGVTIGDGAGESVDKTRTIADLVAIGKNAAKNLTFGRNCIAIGGEALSGPAPGRHNIAIGSYALCHIAGVSSTGIEGSRNTCIGGNTGHFITTGNRNIIVGRDAGHAITTGTRNVVIGNGSWIADCANTPEPDTVVNQVARTGSYNIFIGTEAACFYQGTSGVCIGALAAYHAKGAVGFVAVGSEAGKLLDSDVSPFGTEQTLVEVSGTYAQSNSSSVKVTTSSAHGAIAGGYVRLRFTSGNLATASAEDDVWYIVDSVESATKFTISTYPANGETKTIPPATDSGNLSISAVANSTSKSSGINETVLVGRLAGAEATSAKHAVVIGHCAGQKVPDYCTIVGRRAGIVATGDSLTAIGCNAGLSITTGTENTAIGKDAMSTTTTGYSNLAVGVGALKLTQNGDNFNFHDCIGLGNYSRASGNKQMQLGNSEHTPYVYTAVQVRSDARDKADVRDTVFGLDFIKALHPVDFRWDYRDDYIEIVEDGVDEDGNTLSHVVHHEKDGSRKRTRFHQGFLAQEVKAAADSLGVDFSGYQDHSVNGGQDVLSLGYESFIAPIVKAIQELNTRLEALEGV